MADQKNAEVAEAAKVAGFPLTPKLKLPKTKRPLSAYNRFMKAKMAELTKLEWPQADKLKEIGNQWYKCVCV